MWRYSSELIRQLPISKIRFLGGKLGKRIAALNINTGAELQQVCASWCAHELYRESSRHRSVSMSTTQMSQSTLEGHFGSKTGSWLYNLARGIDTDAGASCRVAS